MKVHKWYTIFFLLGIFAVSCGNDPIFYIISTETVPRPPRIEGAPTNMVKFEREYPSGSGEFVPVLYVASGRFHSYARAPGADSPDWDSDEYRIPSPGGKIISLAVTKDYLYALCLNGESLNATLYYIGHSDDDPDNPWKMIDNFNFEGSEYPLIQSICADPATNRLFVSARQRSNTIFALLYLGLDDNNTPTTLKMLKGETAMLSGAVYRDNSYYLCTRGRGIFKVEETELANDSPNIVQIDDGADDDKNNNRMFMGMIKLEDGMIIAVERRGGNLYEVQDGAFLQMYDNNGNSIATGRYATGALTLWEDSDHSMKKIVAGIQGGLYTSSSSSYTNGYVEFDLIYSTGAFDKDSPRRDSNRLQTVSDTDRYMTSLGKHPINHLFQAPQDIDPEMTFFASTQTAGLWSYRDRPNNGGPQWNAEE